MSKSEMKRMNALKGREISEGLTPKVDAEGENADWNKAFQAQVIIGAQLEAENRSLKEQLEKAKLEIDFHRDQVMEKMSFIHAAETERDELKRVNEIAILALKKIADLSGLEVRAEKQPRNIARKALADSEDK